MEEPYRMLFIVASAFKKWEEQKDVIPEEIYDGLRLFIKECSVNGVVPPTDIKQLEEILMLPSKEWGISGLKKLFPPDASLLDKEIGLTIEAEDFLEEFLSPDEYEQSAMKQILVYCRKNNLEDTYRKIRTFLSKPEHAVIPFQTLYQFMGTINNYNLVNLFSSCYENINNLDGYRKCPNCGWTLEWKNGYWRCNKEDICRSLADFTVVEPFPQTAEKMLRMKSGIQKYILLPGMAELRMEEKLSIKGVGVTLYPNIDEYDLKIEKDDKEILLDVKDYRDPYQLALYINRINLSDLNKDVWYVIPDYRTKNYEKYPIRIKNHLTTERQKIVTVLTETEAMRRIGEMLT